MTDNEIIKFLQSKQIPQCGDKEYTADEEYEAYQKAIDAVEQTTWIPVSERLPEKSGDYLCTFGGNNLTGIDFYTTKSDAKKLFDEPEEYAGWRSQNVIAWMPLPPSYQGE